MTADLNDVLKNGLGSDANGNDYAPTRHEHLLRDDPKRYAELVSNVSAYGIYMMDADGYILSWNNGAANITGYTEREVLGMPQSKVTGEPVGTDGVLQRAMHFARLNGHCSEIQARARRNGERYFAHITLDVVRDAAGEIAGFIEVFSDITEQKAREDALYRTATRDSLTGVFTRGHFFEMANMEIDRARRFAEPLSVAMFDIDHFKAVNDTYGHAAGDKVIIALTQGIAGFIRKIDFIGRIGGEEFALLLPRANKEPALEVAQRLRLILSEQAVDIGEAELNFTVSVGVAALRPTTRDLPDLLRNADAALYKAKREGRNRAEAWFE
jgi:diguanylate cyclase (GGDEF)-like protein/PAS domain S-box-containing protein